MAGIECVVERCKQDACIIFDTCDTRKKVGVKQAELTSLEKAQKEKEELQIRIAELEKAIPKIKSAPIPEPKPEQVVTPTEKKKSAGRPRKNG